MHNENMAEANKSQEEPSIEEILGSIRRIIADDEDEDVTPAVADSDNLSDSSVEEPDEEEPLELTQKIDPDGMIEQIDAHVDSLMAQVVEPSSNRDSADDIKADLSFNDAEQSFPDEFSEEDIVLREQESTLMTDDIDMNRQDDLLSETTADATTAVMAKLARHTALTEEGHDGITIENIVREMLKPMLKEWLDQNLPELVQRMVERELEKLTKRL